MKLIFFYISLVLDASFLFSIATDRLFLTEYDDWVRQCEKTTSHNDVKLYGEFLAGKCHVHGF